MKQGVAGTRTHMAWYFRGAEEGGRTFSRFSRRSFCSFYCAGGGPCYLGLLCRFFLHLSLSLSSFSTSLARSGVEHGFHMAAASRIPDCFVGCFVFVLCLVLFSYKRIPPIAAGCLELFWSGRVLGSWARNGGRGAREVLGFAWALPSGGG